MCKTSAKNIKLYGTWNSSKFSIFQTSNLALSEIIELCLNLGIRFCITWLVLLKNHSVKANFKLTTQATLRFKTRYLQILPKQQTVGKWNAKSINSFNEAPYLSFVDQESLPKGLS